MAKPAEPPHKVDLHVGAMIRTHRRLAKMSQRELGDAVGVTFQQLQKYETGKNRVSASKLYEMSLKLGVPLSAFFEGLEDGIALHAAGSDSLLAFARQRGASDLMNAFMALPPTRRGRLVELAVSLAEPDQR